MYKEIENYPMCFKVGNPGLTHSMHLWHMNNIHRLSLMREPMWACHPGLALLVILDWH